jgi:hypothetical protein
VSNVSVNGLAAWNTPFHVQASIGCSTPSFTSSL